MQMLARWREFEHACEPKLILALIAENERLNVMTATTMGVGSGEGSLFVHGDYDSIKAAQAIVIERDQLKAECEVLRKDAERYRWLRDSDYAGKILRDMGARYRADSDQRIDAAMGKGEQS
jgi:hypothetical protein